MDALPVGYHCTILVTRHELRRMVGTDTLSMENFSVEFWVGSCLCMFAQGTQDPVHLSSLSLTIDALK
jgi:hypothetical protein